MCRGDGIDGSVNADTSGYDTSVADRVCVGVIKQR